MSSDYKPTDLKLGTSPAMMIGRSEHLDDPEVDLFNKDQKKFLAASPEKSAQRNSPTKSARFNAARSEAKSQNSADFSRTVQSHEENPPQQLVAQKSRPPFDRQQSQSNPNLQNIIKHNEARLLNDVCSQTVHDSFASLLESGLITHRSEMPSNHHNQSIMDAVAMHFCPSSNSLSSCGVAFPSATATSRATMRRSSTEQNTLTSRDEDETQTWKQGDSLKATSSGANLVSLSSARQDKSKQYQQNQKKSALMEFLQRSDFFSRPVKVSELEANVLSPSSS